MLWLPGGSTTVIDEVDGASTPRVGDLVRIVGPPGEMTVVVEHAHATGEFPSPGSDASRFGDPALWARLRARADLAARTRQFFATQGFLEVQTPLVVDAPGTEVHIAPTKVSQRQRPGDAPADRYLICSPEHHLKRLLAAGSGSIYQFGPVFRDGEYGRHHRPEFSLLEWYRPWADLDAVLSDCESWLCGLAGAADLTYQGHRVTLERPWPRVPFLDALAERGGITEPHRLTSEEQLRALVDHVEPTLGIARPEFLVDYPIAMASLARPNPTDPSVSERAELYVAGLELANGFGELTDAAEQRRRFARDNAARHALGRPELPIDEAFLAALEQGMPPSAGMAVGFDRVVMLLTGASDIDQVLTF